MAYRPGWPAPGGRKRKAIMVEQKIEVSVVIPVLDERENVGPLTTELLGVLAGLARPFEVIFVDDGSRDNSLSILEKFAENDPEHIVVVAFRRNFGQTAAIAAGIDHACVHLEVRARFDQQLNEPGLGGIDDVRITPALIAGRGLGPQPQPCRSLQHREHLEPGRSRGRPRQRDSAHRLVATPARAVR